MLRVCCIDLWQAAPMRRKCRLADTWLTQRVLLDSWNVTLFQGAECCTLNLSPSNNHFLSNMPAHAECGNDRSAAEGKHRANHVCAFRREVTLKLTVLITKYKSPFFFALSCKYKHSNVENLQKCQHMFWDTCDHKGRMGKKYCSGH